MGMFDKFDSGSAAHKIPETYRDVLVEFGFDEETIQRVLDMYEPMMFMVPTEPGNYLDSEGGHWTLRANGQFYDKRGVTRPPAYNILLVTSAPFTRVEEQL